MLKQQLWFAVIETKNAAISIRAAIPQALAYMLNNPQRDRPIFGLLTNGDNFAFIKLVHHQGTPYYALSEQYTLWKRENELYKVLGLLKKLSQLISQ